MFDIGMFKSGDYLGSRVLDARRWGNMGIGLVCDFAAGDIAHFDLSFDGDLPFNEFEDVVGSVIFALDITRKDRQFRVKIDLAKDGEEHTIEFLCKRVGITPKKYRGKSYRNMYEAWGRRLTAISYVENNEYFEDEETHCLEEFTLSIKNYSHCDDKREYARLSVCELTSGKLRYQYRSTSYSNPYTFFDIIHHSNGHRYFPFHIDLYGISYLDVDSGEVYHYIPEGYEHDAAWDFGESFIVTDIHYDPRTNLIAYGGCYWGGPSDVMVGDFSEPLDFDPHLTSMTDFIDPERDECPDIDFVRFEENGIVVRSNNKMDFLIEFNKLKSRLGGR